MSILKYGFLSLFFLFTYSCSDIEDDSTPSHDAIIGMWEGSITQPDYGTLDLNINITSILKSTKAGSISYTTTDISQCDNDIFDCVNYSCTGSWVFTEKTGSTYKFNEEFSSNSECVNGFVELTFIGKDELKFSWVEDYFEPTTASGTMKRKN